VDRLVRWGVYAAVLLVPLPFAAVQPGAVLLLELLALLVGLGAVWRMAGETGRLPDAARRASLPLALMLLVGAVQLVPLPAGLLGAIGEPTWQVRQQLGAVVPQARVGWAPLSLSPPATVDALLRLCAYAALGLGAAVSLRERRHRARFALVLALSASFQAVYGAAELLSGHQHIFGYAKKYFLESATGTFINRNHFAGYLAIAIPPALAVATLGEVRRRVGSGLRRTIVRLFEPDSLRALLAAAAVVLAWIGVLLSYSRGGLAAALVGTCCFAALVAGPRRRLVVGLLVAIPVAALSWSEIRAPGERFLETGQVADAGGRLPIWRSTLSIVRDYPLLGSGLGTYDAVSLLYRTPEQPVRPEHAHNDWLQSAAEGGLPTAALAVWLLLAVLRPRALLRRAPRPAALTAGLAAALLALGFHALVDFPLRIPALTALTACLAGALCAAHEDEQRALQSAASTLSNRFAMRSMSKTRSA